MNAHTSFRRKHKRDENHCPIVKRLRDLGASVFDLHRVGDGMTDLLVGFCKVTFLVEVKTENGTLTPAQKAFREEWRGAPPVEVRSVEEAQAWYLRTRKQFCLRAEMARTM